MKSYSSQKIEYRSAIKYFLHKECFITFFFFFFFGGGGGEDVCNALKKSLFS